MHVYIIFTHPSKKSFTYAVLESFTKGLMDAGHTFEIGDLYEMNFKSDMDLYEYNREISLDASAPLPEDVRAEHTKIETADALAFIYPVWWSDCPAKLKGWFDRVWSYGYAYFYDDLGDHSISKIPVEKALVVCPAGHPVEYLEQIGIAESMRRIMLNDRMFGVGIKQAKMEILGGMVANDEKVRESNLIRAYQLGRGFENIF
jgi:NAD(P)H dehydrogenase (quinone)